MVPFLECHVLSALARPLLPFLCSLDQCLHTFGKPYSPTPSLS